MRLSLKELQLARLSLCLLYHSLKNQEAVGLDTMLSAFKDAGIPQDENPLSRLNPKELLEAAAKLVPPDPNTDLIRGLAPLDTVENELKEAGMGEQPGPLTE